MNRTAFLTPAAPQCQLRLRHRLTGVRPVSERIPDKTAVIKPPQSKASSVTADPKAGAKPGFWKQKTLEELTPAEWESLCDGCGRCCLVKLEDETSGTVHFTDIACKLFDPLSCRCKDYARRLTRVRDCIRLTPAKVRALSWLPASCAYRLVAEGRDLPWWHPLVSGSQTTVHEAGISVRGRVGLTENEVKPADYPHHIVAWPRKRPYTTRRVQASG
jgi:uncharacterized protein